jgi:hypothetical protein
MKYRDVTLGRVEAVWNKLGGEAGVAKFLSGLTEVVPMERVIDCDPEPFHLDSWKIAEHRKGGKMIWDASKVGLYLANLQNIPELIKGEDLRKELRNMPVMNGCVLHYLLENPHLIPEKWKELKVHFWGTIYEMDNELFVEYLSWSPGLWCSGTTDLTEVWHRSMPVAVFEK